MLDSEAERAHCEGPHNTKQPWQRNSRVH